MWILQQEQWRGRRHHAPNVVEAGISSDIFFQFRFPTAPQLPTTCKPTVGLAEGAQQWKWRKRPQLVAMDMEMEGKHAVHMTSHEDCVVCGPRFSCHPRVHRREGCAVPHPRHGPRGVDRKRLNLTVRLFKDDDTVVFLDTMWSNCLLKMCQSARTTESCPRKPTLCHSRLHFQTL